MKNRIEQLIKSEGCTASKFADILGVQASNISHILSGRNKPSLDFIEKVLLNFPDVSPDWLITGVGDVYRSKNKVDPERNSQVTDVTNPTLFPESNEYICKEIDATEKKNTNVTELNPSQTYQTEIHQNKQELQKKITSPETSSDNDIDRIVIFYKNKTFVSYNQ